MAKSWPNKTESSSTEEGGAGFGDDRVAVPSHLFVECGAGQRRAGAARFGAGGGAGVTGLFRLEDHGCL